MSSITGVIDGRDRLVTFVTIGISSGQRSAKGGAHPDIRVRGFWDTGADVLVVDSHFVRHLELDSRGLTSAIVGGAKRYTPTFSIDVRLEIDGEVFLIQNAQCIADRELRRNNHYDMLVGKPILDRVVFSYDGPNRVFSVWNSLPM